MPHWSVDFLTNLPQGESSEGLHRGTWELARELTARGHAVRVLYPETDGESAPADFPGVVSIPVPLVGVGRRPLGREIAIGRNASALLDPKADVVVGNDARAGAIDLPRSTAPGRPVFVYFVHDIALHQFDARRAAQPSRAIRQRVGDFLDRRALTRLEGAAVARAHRVVVSSESTRSLLAKYYRVAPERLVSIPHGVPDPLEVGSRESARTALRVPLDVPMVAFIGRNPDREGLTLALDAFRRVRSLFPGARFVVVGSALPPEPGVMALGDADERTRAQVLRSTDVFVYPARFDDFALAPEAAMRYGVATVVSAHVPMDGPELDRVRRRVATDDAEEYARELAELFADPALRRTLGEAAKTWSDQFSYAAMATRVEQMIEPLLG